MAQLGAHPLTSLGDLRHAVEEQQIVLHYQPQLELRTGEVKGVEALSAGSIPPTG